MPQRESVSRSWSRVREMVFMVVHETKCSSHHGRSYNPRARARRERAHDRCEASTGGGGGGGGGGDDHVASAAGSHPALVGVGVDQVVGARPVAAEPPPRSIGLVAGVHGSEKRVACGWP